MLSFCLYVCISALYINNCIAGDTYAVSSADRDPFSLVGAITNFPEFITSQQENPSKHPRAQTFTPNSTLPVFQLPATEPSDLATQNDPFISLEGPAPIMLDAPMVVSPEEDPRTSKKRFRSLKREVRALQEQVTHLDEKLTLLNNNLIRLAAVLAQNGTCLDREIMYPE